MNNKLLARHHGSSNKKRLIVIIGLVVVIVATVLVLSIATKPQRSVAAYCKVHKEQTALLGHVGGSKYTYSSAVFPDASSNDPADFVPAFRKLDKAAPDEIQPQVRDIGDIFQKMSDEPSQVLSLAMNGLAAEKAVTEWTQQNCKVDL